MKMHHNQVLYLSLQTVHYPILKLKCANYFTVPYLKYTYSIGCPKKMVIMSGFEFLILGEVFLGVKIILKLWEQKSMRLFSKNVIKVNINAYAHMNFEQSKVIILKILLNICKISKGRRILYTILLKDF